jgi:hypothetical protein
LLKTNAFLQKWKVLLRAGDRDKLEKLITQTRVGMEAFLQQQRGALDDVFI